MRRLRHPLLAGLIALSLSLPVALILRLILMFRLYMWAFFDWEHPSKEFVITYGLIALFLFVVSKAVKRDVQNLQKPSDLPGR